jgi:hypothetical protein
MMMSNEAEKQETDTTVGGLIDPVVMCWTPVSEKLPDNGKMVLVTINTETPCSGVSSYTPCDGGQWYRWQEADEYKTDTPYYSDYDMEITHWMYMPEAFGT